MIMVCGEHLEHSRQSIFLCLSHEKALKLLNGSLQHIHFKMT